ncbi:MAG: hypothetical protein ACOYKJ_06090 [Candidatus Howiella sp.]|jgi:hypothetical protein
MKKQWLKTGCVALSIAMLLSGPAPAAAQTTEKEETLMPLTEEMVSMHKNTYLNLSGRITSRGYSATSVTGTYPGMFPRDSAIDAMAMLKFGDLDSAQRLLNYLLTYNQWYGCGFMAHILDNLQDEAYGNDYLGDPVHASATEAFYAQTASNRDLYLLNAPNNKGVQPFAVPYGSVTGVRLNLKKTYDTDRVVVRILTDYRDPTTLVASADYTFGENPSGWQTILFDRPVELSPNRLYYLEVSAEDSGRVVWTGISAGGDFQSINYDLVADGGWRTGTGDITAFEMLSEEETPISGVFSQKQADHELYLLNEPNNKAAQPFTAAFTAIGSVCAYLTSTGDTDRVTVRILEDYQNDASAVAEQTFSLGEETDGWRRLVFDQPVQVEAGKRYYLELSVPEDCGRVAWKGSGAVDGYSALNYDQQAYGGWYTDEKTTAFVVEPYVSVAGQPAARKFRFAVAGKLTGVKLSLRAAQAGGTLRAELRESLNGEPLAVSEAAIDRTGESVYTLSFEQPADIPADSDYCLVVQTDGAPGEVALLSTQEDIAGNCFAFDGDEWVPTTASFSIEPVRQTGALAAFGGETFAEQEIPTYSEETITAVQVRLGRAVDTDGVLSAALYKQIGTERILVATDRLPLKKIGTEGSYTFRFGLPLDGRANAAGNYILRLSAKDAPAGSLTWFGAADADRFASCLGGGREEAVAGDFSFTAYRSYLTPTCDAARQVDCTYMVAYAWVQFYKAAAGNAQYNAWLEASYPLVAKLCNYYLQEDDQFNEAMDLIYNPHFEHTRNTQYHKGYDLITNVFASQSLYEMAEIAVAFGDSENASFWAEMDRRLVAGIEKTLICTFDGETIYAEMLGQMVTENGEDYFIPGFSWVNLAPIAANWHAANTEILNHTLEKYRKFGSVDYNGYSMLDACVFLNTEGTGLDTSKGRNGTSAHVIGKGWSWELMFAAEQGDAETVSRLLSFSLAHRADSNLYTENWTQFEPGVIAYSDPGNQEHASWQLYAMCTLYPELTLEVEPDMDACRKWMDRAVRAQTADYTAEGRARLDAALSAAETAVGDPLLLQAEAALCWTELREAVTDVLPVQKGDVDFDGRLTVSDVVGLRQAITEDEYGERQRQAGDLDGNDTLTVSDVVELRSEIVNGSPD